MGTYSRVFILFILYYKNLEPARPVDYTTAKKLLSHGEKGPPHRGKSRKRGPMLVERRVGVSGADVAAGMAGAGIIFAGAWVLSTEMS